jgi:hypothetical protein
MTAVFFGNAVHVLIISSNFPFKGYCLVPPLSSFVKSLLNALMSSTALGLNILLAAYSSPRFQRCC